MKSIPLARVSLGVEFKLAEAGDGRWWHVTQEVTLVSPVRVGRGAGGGHHKKPCPDAVRVMSRQGSTKWLPPGTPVIMRTPTEE